MNWKAIFNPWGEALRLREQNAYLKGQINELRAWAEEEVDRAFHRAADHYWQRNRMIEEQNKHMLQRMADLSSIAPLQVWIADNLPPA